MRVVVAVLTLMCAVLGLLVYWSWPRAEVSPLETPSLRSEWTPRMKSGSAVPDLEVDRVAGELPPPAALIAPMDRPEDALAGERVYRFRNAREAEAFMERARDAGYQVLGYIEPLGLVRVRVDESQASALRQLAGQDAEESFSYSVSVPGLPRLPEGMETGSLGFKSSPHEWLGIPRTADWGKGIKIALIDTGIQPHPAFANSRISQVDLLPGTPGNGNHGTAMASLISGTGEHVRGVAPGSELIIFRTLDANGMGTDFSLATGIVRAVDMGVSVIGIPAGTYSNSTQLQAAVDYAHIRGTVIVAASGNDGSLRPLNPAGFQEVLSISAIDAQSRPSWFTNAGGSHALAAPGVDLPSAWGTNEEVHLSGTSVGVPIVVGSIAGIMSENPGMTASQAVDRLFRNADDVGAPGVDHITGVGALNVDRARRAYEPGIVDIGVSPFFIDPAALGGNQVPVQVVVQNRGTTTSNFSLDLSVNGSTRRLRGSPLESGAIKIFSFDISAGDLSAGVSLSAHATTGRQDARPRNDTYSATLRIDSDE